MNIREESALNLTSGAELEKFTLGMIKWQGMDYEILTGWECFKDTCWWCGEIIIQGKKEAHYCRNRSHDDFKSCFRQYWNHFRWDSASNWAKERADYKCENCGNGSRLEVHHIIPLKGSARFFTAFNLPWNLIVLCHQCHLDIHAIMNHRKVLSSWEREELKGQIIMNLESMS